MKELGVASDVEDEVVDMREASEVNSLRGSERFLSERFTAMEKGSLVDLKGTTALVVSPTPALVATLVGDDLSPTPVLVATLVGGDLSPKSALVGGDFVSVSQET